MDVPTSWTSAWRRGSPPSRRSATRWLPWRACIRMRGRIVTTSPDVAVSTSLGGWINKVGVYDRRGTRPRRRSAAAALDPNPSGQHIELGISEMNLFMMLGQLGLSAELLGEPLIPIGTVYDTFIARGLDALILALYMGSQFILVATPSGVTLAPEGGAHQSTVTPSLGIELPDLRAYEPAFGSRSRGPAGGHPGCVDGQTGFTTYLRLTTRPVEQSLSDPIRARSARRSGGASAGRRLPAARGARAGTRPARGRARS